MTAYECPSCGAKSFDRGKCWLCGKKMVAYEAGHKPESGCPQIIGDRLIRHFDYAIGQEVDSKSQLRKIYKAKGLNQTSPGEFRRRWNLASLKKRDVYYSGKTSRRRAKKKPTPTVI